MNYNTSNGVFGDVVEALCHQGYSYGKGSTVEYIQCGDYGIWDKKPQSCTGKVILHNKTPLRDVVIILKECDIT